MSSTRSFKSPGIFAADANTTIPPVPIQGVSYRNASTGADETPDGWPYQQVVDSAEFNQIMFQYGSIIDFIDKHGILGWSDDINYSVPAIVFGSDGNLYIALLSSGPSTAPQDPISSPLYWRMFGSQSGSVTGARKNLKLSATGNNASVSITADQIVVSDGNNFKTIDAVNLTLITSNSGSNGFDTGPGVPISANSWNTVWVIHNPSTNTTASLASASPSAPTMPSGFTMKARVGYIRTDASGNKYPLSFIQVDNQVQYKVASGSNVAALPQMAFGISGSTATPTYTAIAVGSFIPPSATKIKIHAGGSSSNGNIIVAPNNSYGAAGATTNAAFHAGGIAGLNVPFEMILESTNIYWASNLSNAMIDCLGWTDNF